MKSSNTSERLKLLLEEKRLKQADLLRLVSPFCISNNIKMNRSDLSQYVSGKVEPSQEKLSVLSMALDVSEPWLMGYDVSRDGRSVISEHIGSSSPAAQMLREVRENLALPSLSNSSERELLEIYRELNDKGQDMLINTARSLATNPDMKKAFESDGATV